MYLISSALTAPTQKRDFAMFPERGRLLSGQQSTRSRRLLYDGLPCFLGSARFVYAPILIIEKLLWQPCPALRFKTCRQEKKMEIVIQDLDGSLSLSLSTKIPIYMEKDLSMNRSKLSSIRIDISLMRDYADLYMFWPRSFPLQRRRFRSFNLMS